MFSILIPTWNNLSYLQLCIESIRKNSRYEHQVFVHVNEGKDGTADWLQSQGIRYTHSGENIGICHAVNGLGALAEKDYIVYMNDDMYVCPDWDAELLARAQEFKGQKFLLSSTMIEPNDTGNPCVIHRNFGSDCERFEEQALLEEYRRLVHFDWNGSAWPPTLVRREDWFLVGGYSIEFSPGMSSDDDFAMKMWQVGCRIFLGVSKSRVYHFQAKSTARVQKNDGRKQFLSKWGFNQSTFNRVYLKRGTRYKGQLATPTRSDLRIDLFRAWIKRKLI